MDERIVKMLEGETQSDEIVALKKHICDQLKFSRGKLKKRWEQWDRNLKIFEGYKCPDEQDQEAAANAEPEKSIVPMGYAQVMTFATFLYMVLNQNKTFFQLEPTGNEDYPLTETGDMCLERDLRHNKFRVTLFELATDLARFGLACTKTTWELVEQHVEVMSEPTVREFAGFTFEEPGLPVSIPAVKYEGNRIAKISPYRIIPDMRYPLSQWERGKFVADEDEYHIGTLKTMEQAGKCVGVEHIEKMTKDLYKERGWGEGRFEGISAPFGSNYSKASDENNFMVIVTDVDVVLNPKQFGIGEEDYECHYIVSIANDSRIIALEKSGYLHGEFIYDLAQYSPDEHSDLGLALADAINGLQDVITWLINSRIVSLRQGLDKHLVVNPQWIDTDQLEGRQPIIYVRPNSPMMDINRMVQQLRVTDPTTANLPDMEVLLRIMQIVSGINENASGQFAPGRRSATENRNANAGAASRMTLHISLFFEQLLSPMGRKMLSNQRQGLSLETFVKIVGKSSPTAYGPMPIPVELLYEQFCPSDPLALIGSEDFFTVDLTSGSERAYLAQNLQELVIAMASNPQIAMMTQYDITKLIDEIQYLRGVRNVARFKNPVSAQPTAGLPVSPGEVGDQQAPPSPGGAPTGVQPGVVQAVPGGAPAGV